MLKIDMDVACFKELPWHSSGWDKDNQETIHSSTLYANKKKTCGACSRLSGTSEGSRFVSSLTKEVLDLTYLSQ
jgi:hypothetical protein